MTSSADRRTTGQAATGRTTTGLIDPEFTAYRCASWPRPRCSGPRSWGGARGLPRRAHRGQRIGLSDGNLETLWDADDLGLAVRVVVEGTWGFASAIDLTLDSAARAAAEAVEVARVAAAINTERIELAPEPAHGEVSWVSAYQVDPLSVSVAEKVGAAGGLELRAAGPRRDRPRRRVAARGQGVHVLLRRRHHRHPAAGAVASQRDRGGGRGQRRFETMRTLAPPAGVRVPGGRPGRAGQEEAGGSWDFAAELAQMPELLAAKLAAPRSNPAATTWSSTRRTCG